MGPCPHLPPCPLCSDNSHWSWFLPFQKHWILSCWSVCPSSLGPSGIHLRPTVYNVLCPGLPQTPRPSTVAWRVKKLGVCGFSASIFPQLFSTHTPPADRTPSLAVATGPPAPPDPLPLWCPCQPSFLRQVFVTVLLFSLFLCPFA